MDESEEVICGVRFDRAGAVELGPAFGLALSAGDQVLVTDARGQRPGRIVIPPGRILTAPAEALSEWTGVRLVTSDEVQSPGSLEPELEVPEGWCEWLVAPGDPPLVQDDGEESRFAWVWIERVFSGTHAADGAEGGNP